MCREPFFSAVSGGEPMELAVQIGREEELMTAECCGIVSLIGLDELRHACWLRSWK